MHLRIATADDHGAITTLLDSAYARIFERLPASDATPFRAGLPAAVARYSIGGTWLLAESGGKFAGAVAFFPPRSTNHPVFQGNVAHIQLLGVAASSSRSGIGKALMEKCLSLAKSAEASELLLQTSHHMTEARSLYERLGFTVRRELQQVWGAPTYLYAKPCEAFQETHRK
jgi:ribosomal protein S18 acetylase RimI-like enzyme